MPGGFAHFRQSLRVVERLEKDGARAEPDLGGAQRHPAATPAGQDAATLEGQVVRLADKIAYINHDIEDALRGGSDLPHRHPAGGVPRCWALPTGSGSTPWWWTPSQASRGQDRICQSPPVGQAMAVLKEFMFAKRLHQPHRQGGGEQGPGHAEDALRVLPEKPR